MNYPRVLNLINELEFTEERIREMASSPSTVPFDDKIMAFLHELSKLILKDNETKLFPDVATFAFFCRKGNLNKLKKEFLDKNIEFRLGRGLSFHVAPSNVPVNFAFSLVLGLLSGNNCIVRVPSDNFRQIAIITKALKKLKLKELPVQIELIKYDRNSEMTQVISRYSNLRLIWGGNNTVKSLKELETYPNCIDIPFYNRFSLAVIDLHSLNESNLFRELALNFYNDTLLFDQNACTSPHSLFWITSKGVKNTEVINKFWEAFSEIIESKGYHTQMKTAMDKLCSYQQYLSNNDIIDFQLQKSIWRVRDKIISNNENKIFSHSGYFMEYEIHSLEEIIPIISKNTQTIGYFGLEKKTIKSFLAHNRILGVDRIVPIGRTTEFNLTWDGIDLINIMSRIIQVI